MPTGTKWSIVNQYLLNLQADVTAIRQQNDEIISYLKDLLTESSMAKKLPKSSEQFLKQIAKDNSETRRTD